MNRIYKNLSKLKSITKLFKPDQWNKLLVIFPVMIFPRNMFDFYLLITSIVSFMIVALDLFKK